MLSIPGSGVRPRVTVVPACSNAEFSTPAKARLRVIHAACAVFHATNLAGVAGACGRTAGRTGFGAGGDGCCASAVRDNSVPAANPAISTRAASPHLLQGIDGETTQKLGIKVG